MCEVGLRTGLRTGRLYVRYRINELGGLNLMCKNITSHSLSCMVIFKSIKEES
jgi:hypothetical protein